MIRGFTVGVGHDDRFHRGLRSPPIGAASPRARRPSVPVCDGQAYQLKPVLRVVDNLEVGTITGTVDSTFIAGQCESTTSGVYPGNVYLFGPVTETEPGTPDDYDGIWDDLNGADALASAMVDANSFSYTIGFVPAGNYRLAYTCDTDDPEVDANEANLPDGRGRSSHVHAGRGLGGDGHSWADRDGRLPAAVITPAAVDLPGQPRRAFGVGPYSHIESEYGPCDR